MIYMIDTCSLGLMRKEQFKTLLSSGLDFCFTHIQRDEIEAYANERRRTELSTFLKNIVQVNTSITVWGQSRWNEAEWGDNEANDIYKIINKELNDVYNNAEKKAKSNINDAIIATTAIKNGYTLITQDKNLKKIAKQVSPELNVLSFEEFKKLK